MAKLNETLKVADYRIAIYTIDNKYITDVSTIHTTGIRLNKHRNKPDNFNFTLDLYQFEQRAKQLGGNLKELLEPYRYKVKIFRDNKFLSDGIIESTQINLNNQDKNTIEIRCASVLSILEKRLIHQSYGHSTWAEIAKQVIMDAQHEPNRIFNYSFEGEGQGIVSTWFKGWDFATNELPDFKPNTAYSKNFLIHHNGMKYAAKKAFTTEEEFNGNNWIKRGEVCVRSDSAHYGASACGVHVNDGLVSTTLVSHYHYDTKDRIFYVRGYVKKVVANGKIKILLFNKENRAFLSVEPEQSETTEWQKIEYYFPYQTEDIYRVGFQASGTPYLLDDVVAYQDFSDGDEWDLGVRVGVFKQEPSWRRTRSVTQFVWKQARNTLYDLANMESDNFEFYIDENYKFNIAPRFGREDIHLSLSYPGNITGLTITSNAKDIFNYSIADGSDDIHQDSTTGNSQINKHALNPYGIMTIRTTDMLNKNNSLKRYGALASRDNYSSTKSMTELNEVTDSKLDSYSQIVIVPNTSVKNNIVTPGNIGLGDVVAVIILGDGYASKVTGLYRVIGYQLEVSQINEENMMLTLAAPGIKQLNTFDLAGMIKDIKTKVLSLSAKK